MKKGNIKGVVVVVGMIAGLHFVSFVRTSRTHIIRRFQSNLNYWTPVVQYFGSPGSTVPAQGRQQQLLRGISGLYVVSLSTILYRKLTVQLCCLITLFRVVLT